MVRCYLTEDRIESPGVRRFTSPVQTRHYGRVLGSGNGLNGWQQILVLVVSVRRSVKNNCKISHRKPGPGDIKTFITTKVQKKIIYFLKTQLKIVTQICNSKSLITQDNFHYFPWFRLWIINFCPMTLFNNLQRQLTRQNVYEIKI